MQKGLYCVKVCSKRVFSLILSFCYVFCCCGFLYCFGVEEGVTSKSNPKLSVVVPVYNVAPYLDEALDSVENQTYKDMEVICVNDGSTDNSPEILEKHAKKDKRIKVINQENQGVSKARNAGMKAATGKYIYFFDSDDVLAPYAMEKAIKNLEKYDADVLEMGIKKFNYGSSIDLKEYFYKDLPITLCKYKKGRNLLEIFNTKTSAVWSYVYKKSFLTDNNLCFKKEIKTHEDVVFTYIVKSCVKKLVKDPNIGYFHRVKRPGSIIYNDSRDVYKRINGFLDVVHELVLNKKRFDFPGGKKVIFGWIFDVLYYDIAGLDNLKDKSFYAGRAYEEVCTNYVEKYSIGLNKTEQKRLDDLKKWSKGNFSEQKSETKKDKKQGKKIKNKEKTLKKGKKQGDKAKKSAAKVKGKVNSKNKK